MSSSSPSPPPPWNPPPPNQPPPTSTSSSSSSSSSSDVTISLTTPLLSSPTSHPRLCDAVRFLRRAGSRRAMREPSMLVREAAAEQLEERQTDWAYSKPVVVLDVIWNFAFIAAAVAVMIVSRDEAPSMPLRVWIVGYAMQCVLHVVCVVDEFRRRERRRIRRGRSGDADTDEATTTEEGRARLWQYGLRSVGEYVSLAQFSNEESSRYNLVLRDFGWCY